MNLQIEAISTGKVSPSVRERLRSYRRLLPSAGKQEERGRRRCLKLRATVVVTLAAIAATLVACGGEERQDENEPEGTWKVDVVSASFPGRQHLAEEAEMRITVKNVDSRAVPNLAVTVDGFDIREEEGQLSDPRRPIWVIDEPPDNSTTAFTNTWSVGEVPPGETRTLSWNVAAVRAGTYTVRWRIGAGLHGKAKARLPDGSIPKGSFIARISDKPRKPKID
jgi:hypothetical protein